MKKLFTLLFVCLLSVTISFADPIAGRLNIEEEDASPSTFPYKIKFPNGSVTDNSDGTISVATSGSPTDATYITQTANSTLSAEQALSLLSTGLMKVTTGTGVISSVTDSSANWDTAYTDRLKWDGGATGLVAATGRTSLGLVIGTDVQAQNANLASLAGLSYVSPSFAKMTGANTFSLDTNTYQTTLTNSAGLAAALSDESGTDKVAFTTSPVFTTPNIGSATGSISGNAATVTTNANLTGPITSVGNATSIASQTGTGTKFVVDTSPTLVTPAIGAATGTSLITTGLIQTGQAGTDGQLKIYSEQGVTDYSVTINPHVTMTQDVTYTLPADDGTANQVLSTDGAGALSWAAAGSGANTALSNLASVAVNTSLISDTDSTDDLGSSSIYWANAYIDKVVTPAISFPATQVSDAGANVLDDYEEGTWTAAFTAGTSGTITINNSYKTGSYTKIGRQVTLTGYLIVSSVSTPVGLLSITGIPFTNASGDSYVPSVSLASRNLLATGTTMMQGFIASGGSTIVIEHFTAGAAGDAAADTQAGTAFMVLVTYFTN